ncbi:MAG: D-alanyl-D-alanine carboxypeptidase [Oscillospiraceae bacterium]|nr:D-alanyl-D-alanine carboxypeptidase [Oscillospiraceae bacterium]
MLKKFAPILLLVFMLQILIYIPVSASVTFRNIAAQAAILADRETGEILFAHNIHTQHPPDSLNKIMTLLLAAYAVENDIISDHELITMTETAWYDITDESSSLGIEPGEVMTFIDLIYSSFVGDANEASNMIALRIGGSIDNFVRMMNDRAAEIGATNTHFVNAHGQFNPTQHTTAYDQFLIFNEAMRSLIFAEVSSTFRHVTEATEESEPRTITTSNSLLNQGSRYYLRHSISGKASNSYEGGRSLVAYADENDLSLISVVLGSYDNVYEDGATDIRSFSETLRLFAWGFDQFAWRDILKTTDLLARIPVMYGSGADFVNARPESALTLLLDESIPTEAFARHITIFSEESGEPLAAPINAGDVLGEVRITRDGHEYARIPLVANTNVNLSGVESIRREIVDMLATNTARNIMLILGGSLFIYFALLIRYHVVRANRLRRIRNAKNDIIRERHQGFHD